jgi:hypothetical protein
MNKVVSDILNFKVKFNIILEKLIIHYNKISIKYLVIMTIINCIFWMIILVINIYVNVDLNNYLDYYVEGDKPIKKIIKYFIIFNYYNIELFQSISFLFVF